MLESFKLWFGLIWALAAIYTALGAILVRLTESSNDKLLGALRSTFLFGKLEDLTENHKTDENLNPRELSLFQKLQVPKRWFAHFYIYFLFSSFFVLGLLVYLRNDPDRKSPIVHWCKVIFLQSAHAQLRPELFFTRVNCLLLGAMFLQSFRRFYETQFVSIFSDAQMHISHYLLGLVFYFSVSFLILDTILNTSLDNQTLVKPLLYFSLYLLSAFIQFHSNITLANLRKPGNKDQNNRITGNYYLPRAGLFRYVACPHYLGEILTYLALYLLTGLSVPGQNILWAILGLFVLANQTVTAQNTLRWYRTKFGSKYPQNIKAIIPFLV